MPFCPQCGDEFRPGFTVCADCDVPLVAEPPGEARDESAGEWEVVANAREVYEGELMALRLREAGIEANVMDRSLHQFPSNAPQSTVIEILVPAARADEARRILAEPVGLPEDAEDEGEAEAGQAPGENQVSGGPKRPSE